MEGLAVFDFRNYTVYRPLSLEKFG